jgi:hypothetical protein
VTRTPITWAACGGPGGGNTAYSSAARTFFKRWPDPQQWAAEPLQVRLSAGTATRPIITFLMLDQGLRPGYDYLLERKLSSIWREIRRSGLRCSGSGGCSVLGTG